MHRALGTLIFGIVLILASNALSWMRRPLSNDFDLPEIKSHLVSGRIFQLKEYKGKPFMVYFWGTWCSACSLQAPAIQPVFEDYRVVSIAVNSGDNQTIQSYPTEAGYTFEVINDFERQWQKLFRVSVFPTIFIFDSQGKLSFTEVGYTSELGLRIRLGWLRE